MLLCRAVAASASVAVPVSMFTVYADDKPSRRINIAKLPIYEDPPTPEFEFIPEKDTAFLKNVSLFRQEVWKFMDKYKETQEVVMQKYEVSKAHTQDLLQYIREDSSVLPRAGIITVAGLGGVVAGYKGGILRRTFFCAVAMTTAASICYPNQAVDIASVGWGNAKGSAKELWDSQSKTKEEAPKPVEKVSTAEPVKESKDTKKTAESSSKVVDESKMDHGMSKSEDKDMYTTRSS